MAKKGSRVTRTEAEKMYQMYQGCGSISQVAKSMKRDRGTVARHIHAYEAGLNIPEITIVIPKDQTKSKMSGEARLMIH